MQLAVVPEADVFRWMGRQVNHGLQFLCQKLASLPLFAG